MAGRTKAEQIVDILDKMTVEQLRAFGAALAATTQWPFIREGLKGGE